MALTRRALLRASALTAGAVMLTRPLGVLGQPLGAADAGTSRASRLFPGQRLIHADMHNHTIFSDADPGATPELAYETMSRGGMDVAALTDHSSVSWAPAGVPSEFLCPPDDDPLGAGEGCRSVFGLSNEEWARTAELAGAFTVTPAQAAADPAVREYLGVRGFEWSSPTLGHVNVWFSREYIDPLHTGGISGATTAADFVHEGRDADPTPISAALTELLRDSGEVVGTAGMTGFQQWLSLPPDSPGIGGGNDGLAGFNHPGREADRFGDFAYEPALRDRVVSLELLNRREDYLFELVDVGRRSPLVECLAKGWRPGILGVSDEHAPVKRDDDLGKGRAGMWVGELSAVGVREAMRQRRFFATRLKGLRVDAAANGVRMGQPFAHPGGRVLVQLDLATGGEHAGRTLSCHVIGPPADGELLPAILHEQPIGLPTDGVIEFTVDVDPERHPWFALRLSEPGPSSGEGFGFGPDGRAAGTAYEPLGAAWAYTSPWYLDASAPAAPASGRAPLTEEDTGGGDGGSTGGGGTGGGAIPTPTPTPSPTPTDDPTDPDQPDEPASPPADEPTVNPTVSRRAGPTRIETAVALSQATFVEGLDTVFIADGEAFPDALAGAAAAATIPGPVLLVTTDAVPDPVVGEVQRLRPRRIVILGGVAVVGPAVEARLRDLAEVVERLAGQDRYATAAAISDAVFAEGAEEVWVASGETFADALPAGPAVAQARGPLLLTARDALPEATADALRRLAPRRIVVLGGTAVIDEAVVTELQQIASTERLAGDDRFATAGEVSRRAFPRAQAVVVAGGEDFPDALASGPVAFAGSGPVLLVRRDDIPPATDAELRRLTPEIITVAGGTAAVSDAVRRSLAAYDIRSDS